MQRPTWLPSQESGLAADRVQVVLVKGGQGFWPEDFPLRFYKSASKTATFMPRCHIQGPAQDQLLAEFDSLSRSLGQSSPNRGTGKAWFLTHSIQPFFLVLTLLLLLSLFPCQGVHQWLFYPRERTLTKETCYPSKRISCNLAMLTKGGSSSIDQALWIVTGYKLKVTERFVWYCIF